MYNFLNLQNQNNIVQNDDKENNDKENNFVRLVRICLAKPLFDFLFDFLFDNNLLLFLNKNLTDIFIPLFIKNKMIKFNIAIRWPNNKRNLVKHLLINNAHFNNILSFTNLTQVTFGIDFCVKLLSLYKIVIFEIFILVI